MIAVAQLLWAVIVVAVAAPLLLLAIGLALDVRDEVREILAARRDVQSVRQYESARRATSQGVQR